MAAEMAEQPERLAALLDRREEIAALVGALAPAPGALAGTSIVARGSSDNAGVYGRYLIELASGRPAGLASPSLQTLYRARVDYSGYLAVAVSQSGSTPEIVTTLGRMQAAGAAGVAVTNDAASALAAEAQGVVALETGPELAVPATKTVTATMAALGCVAAALGPAPFSGDAARRLPGWVAGVLADDGPAERLAERLHAAGRLVTVGRGLLFGAALETALKLKETTLTAAEGFSAADLRHGPIAVVEPGLPVLALLGDGPARADMDALVGELRRRGARVSTLAGDADADLPLPRDVPEALAAILAVVRAQQLALALARRRGLDPDAPAGLSKVTGT